MSRRTNRPPGRRPAILLAAWTALVLTAVPGAAAEYGVVPDEFVYCTTCHGVALKGNISVDAPRLNGMEAWYVRRQLDAFKRGFRGTHPEDLIGHPLPDLTLTRTDGQPYPVRDRVGKTPTIMFFLIKVASPG